MKCQVAIPVAASKAALSMAQCVTSLVRLHARNDGVYIDEVEPAEEPTGIITALIEYTTVDGMDVGTGEEHFVVHCDSVLRFLNSVSREDKGKTESYIWRLDDDDTFTITSGSVTSTFEATNSGCFIRDPSPSDAVPQPSPDDSRCTLIAKELLQQTKLFSDMGEPMVKICIEGNTDEAFVRMSAGMLVATKRSFAGATPSHDTPTRTIPVAVLKRICTAIGNQSINITIKQPTGGFAEPVIVFSNHSIVRLSAQICMYEVDNV